jgi:hypothetical protein
MNSDQAIEAAKQIGLADGETITLQSDGQIMNPHFHSGQTSGETHVDAWIVTNRGGTYTAEKLHG